jgi:hypothetical protein
MHDYLDFFLHNLITMHTSQNLEPKVTRKMLGDAGEHFALSQFTFAGRPAVKMPDAWPGYDLVVKEGSRTVKVSVKTRSESTGWKTSSWFTFDQNQDCDWLVFIFRTKNDQTRSWILPFSIAKELGNKPGPKRKNAHIREVSLAKLNKEPLKSYENNWGLIESPISHA